MSSQHKAPLAAFLVVSIACIVVVVNALRSDALAGPFVRPMQAIVAGARLIPQPQDILSAEASVVARASAGLEVAPHAVDKVLRATVPTAVTAAPQPAHPRAHHARGSVGSKPAPHGSATTQQHIATPVPTVPAPAAVPAPAPPVWPAHATLPAPAYGHQAHQSGTMPGGRGHRGWGATRHQPAVAAAAGASAGAAASYADQGWNSPGRGDRGRGRGYGLGNRPDVTLADRSIGTGNGGHGFGHAGRSGTVSIAGVAGIGGGYAGHHGWR